VRIFVIAVLFAMLAPWLCAGPETTQPAGRLQFRLVAEDADKTDAQSLPKVDQPAETLNVLKRVELDDRDIQSAKVDRQIDGKETVSITFTDDGGRKLSELTANNLHRRLAIIFDGKILSAPTIQSRIGREATISIGANATGADANDLAKTLNQLVDARSPTTAPASR
jgi:preprotein translocase subunit SecD